MSSGSGDCQTSRQTAAATGQQRLAILCIGSAIAMSLRQQHCGRDQGSESMVAVQVLSNT